MDQTLNVKWYKTGPGKVFVSFLSFLGIIVLSFGLLTGYYFWKIGSGEGDKLSREFSGQFSLDPNKRNLRANSLVDTDLNKFIHDHSPIIGNPEAKITILAFIDFECPFSRKSFPIFQEVVERYGPAIQVVFKHLPVPSLHPNAEEAHLAAACAEEQNNFWPYYEQLFVLQDLSENALLEYAQILGLDSPQFNNCLKTKKYQKQIEQDLLDAATVGVRGTPTYVVNGIKLEGVLPEEIWDEIILEEIKK